jgi:Fur family peroxide stress response transcriptional regulator
VPPIPTPPDLPAATDDLVAILHERGQRVTPQRLAVLRELRRRRRHATADEIGRAVRAQVPGTSTPTVYAALDLLVELGLTRRFAVGAGPVLYDGRTDPHQHAVCRRCGRVDDLDTGASDVSAPGVQRAAEALGFTIDGVEVVVAGTCAECAARVAVAAPTPRATPGG